MIKINLKHTRTAVSQTSWSEMNLTSETSAKSIATNLSESLKNIDLSAIDSALLLKILLKFLLVFSIPFGLKIYEIMNLNSLEERQSAAKAKTEAKKAESSVLQKQIDKYGHLKSKEEEFNKKRKILEELAAGRLVIPRFLDEIQTIIPPNVWLKRIDITQDPEGKTQLALSGEGVLEEEINGFVEELKSVADGNSIRLNTTDVKDGETSVKVSFTINAMLKSED